MAPALFALKRRPLWLILIAIVCIPLVYAATIVLQPLLGDPAYVNDNGFLYFSILNQLPVFICGAGLFIWRGALNRLSAPVLTAFCILPFAVAYYIWTRYFTGTLTFTFVPLLAGISSLFLIALLSKAARFGWLIEEAGQRSFSMYLWNFPVLLVTKSVADSLDVKAPFFVALPIVAAAAFLLSGITYYVIERPFIIVAKRLSQRDVPIGETKASV
jgi:peptidoglycan/LPS O-acetylase OafA/YrhL